MTLPAIAETLSVVSGRSIEVIHVSPAAALARGQSPGWVNSQEWTSEIAYPARPEHVVAFGLVPMTFRVGGGTQADKIPGAKPCSD